VSRGLSPYDLVYGLCGVGDAQISPEGTRIIYVRSDADQNRLRPETQLWICDEADYRPRQLTTGSRQHGNPRWSPNGEEIAFTSLRDGKHGIYTIRPSGGEAVLQCTHPTPPGELAWAPHGIQLAFVAPFDPDNPDGPPTDPELAPPVRVVNRIDYKQENRGFLNNVRHQLWTVEIFTGDKHRLTNDLTDHLAPVWSPNCKMIATKITRRNGMTSQLCVTDAVRGGNIAIIGPEEGFISTWAFTPDNTAILFSGDTSQSWQADWFIHTFESGETRRITEDLPVSVDGGFPTVALPAQPVWLDDDTVIYHGFSRGQSGVYQLTVSSGEHVELATWPAVHAGFSVDTDERKFIVQSRSNPGAAPEVVRIEIATGELDSVDRPNDEYVVDDLYGPWERLTIERGGFEMDGWLLLPPGFDETQRYPLILDIHGGPNSHHGPGFNAVQQALAGAGFAVLYTNPRGSSSYGRAFTMAVVGDWAGEDYLDQMAFTDEICKRPYIDADRVGVYGYSYGGFMTSWIVGHTDRFKAAVIGAPVVDHVSFYGTADIGHTFGPLQIGGTPWENPEEYRRRSPLTYLHEAATPSLILHGEADDRVPVSQGEQAFMTLKQAGCETEFVRYPGEAHAMLRTGLPAHRHDYLTRVVGWFQQHLMVRMPAAVVDESRGG
jgi:dipeptidyl aminopeptidase/acylaminoacyl peptidase